MEQEEEEEEGLPVSRTLRHIKPKGMVYLRMPAVKWTRWWRRRRLGAGLVLVEAILCVVVEDVVWLEEDGSEKAVMDFLTIRPLFIKKIRLFLMGDGGGDEVVEVEAEVALFLRRVIRTMTSFLERLEGKMMGSEFRMNKNRILEKSNGLREN